ncbi:efflux RND transporter permease subunit [Paenibacillus endoradicis]|uniref:efflux RND transporter permease subunit n=1 Tax=Paenibacillus endoradicis TaxID=2972487 RepID=UPI0021599770|nr:efflux RND transporter permease subunit [Paenibacillus endoradicis]MCR8657733.1 efflux RND transporter permease subunit [Paenibacillus endoradicis]
MLDYVLKNRKVTILFFIMATIVGSLSFLTMPKRENPEVSLTIALVQTIYPGASPEKVEQYVTIPIEESIKDISKIVRVDSTSSLNVSTVIVEIEPGSDEENRKVWDLLRQKVQLVESKLPDDSNKPVVIDNLNNIAQQFFQFAVSSPEQLEDLRILAEKWKFELGQVSGVSGVDIIGLPEQEIAIYLNTEKLDQLGLPWGSVIQAISNDYDRVPLGGVKEGETYSYLKLSGDWESIDDINKIIVFQNESTLLRVEDLATVEKVGVNNDALVHYNDLYAVSIVINASSGVDIPSLQNRIDEVVSPLKEELPSHVQLISEFSQKESVNHLFRDLGKELLIGMIIVIIICSLGLSFITSLIVALAIPVSVAIGFIPIEFFGVDLNQISIVALIIVLGILVDDAVVVNDSIQRRLSLGDSPMEASIRGSKDVAISITTATLATIASFVPLYFMTGNVGNFIHPLPVVITLTMLASLIVSVTVIPIFRMWISERLLRKRNKTKENSNTSGLLGKPIHRLSLFYEKQIVRFIKKPVLTAVLALVVGSMSLGLFPLLGMQFFPKAEREIMLIDFSLPIGTSVEKTRDVLNDASEWIREQPGVNSVTLYAGRMTPKFYYSETGKYGENIGQLFVKIDMDQIKTKDMLQPWREALQDKLPDVEIVARELEQGPPVGAPITVSITGDDLTVLQELSQQVKDQLADIEGAINISDDIGSNMPIILFNIDQEQLQQHGVAEKDISTTLRLLSEGIKVADLIDNKDLLNVVLRVKHDEKSEITDAFSQLSVPSKLGTPVKLEQFVSAERSAQVHSIQHEDARRVVTVRGYNEGKLVSEITEELNEKLGAMDIPENYSVLVGGENEQRDDAFNSITKLWIVVVLLIYILMVMQFKSLSIPLIILMSVYLAFGGALIGLFLTNSPLGFMAFMGIVSLTGIVVRNGIILIEYIEQERKQGSSLQDAVASAGKVRLRPILITTFTAVGALTPMAIDGGSLFKPMAVAIISGLLYSTLLTLIVVPVMYVIIARRKEKKIYKSHNSGITEQPPV